MKTRNQATSVILIVLFIIISAGARAETNAPQPDQKVDISEELEQNIKNRIALKQYPGLIIPSSRPTTVKAEWKRTIVAHAYKS